MNRRLEGLAEFAQTAAHGAALSRNPLRLIKLAQKLQSLADREIATVQSEAAASGGVSACRKGCEACCHRIVAASFPEVLQVVEHVRDRFTGEERAALEERTNALEAANSPYWRHEAFLARGVCPFLVDAACSIYDIRPLSCRVRNSFDAAVCRTIYIEGTTVPTRSNASQDEVESLNHAVIRESKASGIPAGLYELGPAVAAALRDPSLLNLSGSPNFNEAPRSTQEGFEAGDIWARERLKVVSEFNVAKTPVSAPLRNHLLDPQKAAAEKLFRSGDFAGLALALNRFKGAPFEILFRLTLPHQYRSAAEMEESWLRWGEALRRFEESDLPARETFEWVQLFDTFSLAYAGRDVRPYLERFMAVLHRLASAAMPELTEPIDRPRKPGKLRVGFFSDRLTNFNGSRWAIGWINRLSPDIETYAFNLANTEDGASLAFRRNSDRYFHLPMPMSDCAPIIRGCDLDALIFTNVGMSGRPIQAAALRLARVQFNCWGHPVTSGSPTMNYYLSSDLMEPPNGADHYSEELIRLPGSGLSYPRLPLRPSAKSAAELGVPEDGFLLIGQMPMKLTPTFDPVYLEIADRSLKPLVFLEGPEGRGNEALRARLGKPGLNTIVLPRQSREDYLRLLQLAHTSVDSLGWNGGNTTVESLTLGTPVVSLPGEFMRGRHGLAFLSQAGVPGLLAADVRDFVELVLDQERQREAMKNVDVDALYGDPTPAHALSSLLLNLASPGG